MSGLSAPHNPATKGARNKCSSSWYRRTNLDHATNYQIGRAKQNAKEVWAHRKPLLGNLINCYLARTVPVPRNIDIEHCSHLLSYLFVYVFFFVFLFLQQCMASILAVHLRDETVTRISFHFTFRRGGGGGMSRYCCVTAYVVSSCIRRFPDDSVRKIRNTESDLYCWFSHDVTLCSGTKKPVNWLVKKQHANGIEKYQALKYSPLILKLQVTFTKRLSFKTTFKGHSIIMYLNHA